MFARGIKAWRVATRAAQETTVGLGRSYSEASTSAAGASRSAGTSKASPFSEAGNSSRLFEKAQAPPEVSQASLEEEATSAAGRILSTIGNTLFFGGLGVSAFFGYYTLRYTTDEIGTLVEETKKPENSFPGSNVWVDVMAWYKEQRERLESEVKKYSDPSSDCLLPDLPPQLRNLQTLVLDLDDTLIHSDWTRGRGWRTFKRPGAEDFIRHLAPYYELVIFTSQLPTYADPILDRLDPGHLIQYRLYRDSTQYTNGKHVRDLSKLNRDLGKVLLITADPDASALQPDNAVLVKKWKMEADDTTLLDLIPFLEAVCSARQVDVRDIVHSYQGQDIPTAFRERIKEAAEQQRRQRQQSRGLFGGFNVR